MRKTLLAGLVLMPVLCLLAPGCRRYRPEPCPCEPQKPDERPHPRPHPAPEPLPDEQGKRSHTVGPFVLYATALAECRSWQRQGKRAEVEGKDGVWVVRVYQD